jgi:hypothetical protein
VGHTLTRVPIAAESCIEVADASFLLIV